MSHKRVISFCLAFLIFLGVNCLFTQSSAAEDKSILHMVYEFKENGPSAVTWDGKQYIGVGGSSFKGYFFCTSPDGLKWEVHKAEKGLITPDKIASNGKITAIAGDFYDGMPTVGATKNGKDWQIRGGQESWSPPSNLVYFNNKFMIFEYGDIFISSDGLNYTKKEIYVTDPRKLTPKGYNYLGGNSEVYALSIATDGKYLYGASTDYYGSSIMRSADGIKWEITCFVKNKDLLEEDSQCIIENGKYMILCEDNKLLVSNNGRDWKIQDFTRSDMCRVGKKSDGSIYSEPPRVYGYKGVYYTQCYNTRNKIDVSKDFKNFYEYSVDRAVTDILFIDDRYIITAEGVIEYKAVKDGIANGFKNTHKSPDKKSQLTKTASTSPSSAKTSGTVLKAVREFQNPYWISSAVWDGTRYVAIGGNYIYTSKDGKSWATGKLEINGLSRLIFEGGTYTAVGKSRIAVSKNAKDWTLILGSNDKDAYFSDSTAACFKGKLFYYDEFDKMQVSDDGLKFRNETLNVTDPQKLVPSLNRSWGCLLYSFVSDGSHLYAMYNWDKEKLVLRSDDGINWEVVCKYESRELNTDRLYIHNGRIVALGGEYMAVSSDGTDWSVEPTPIRSLYVKKSDGGTLPVYLSTYKDWWIVQQCVEGKNQSYTTESRFYITKDLKNFTEYKIEEGAGSFIYVDNKILLTRTGVFDAGQIKELAAD